MDDELRGEAAMIGKRIQDDWDRGAAELLASEMELCAQALIHAVSLELARMEKRLSKPRGYIEPTRFK